MNKLITAFCIFAVLSCSLAEETLREKRQAEKVSSCGKFRFPFQIFLRLLHSLAARNSAV